jgi:hypothetical protein
MGVTGICDLCHRERPEVVTCVIHCSWRKTRVVAPEKRKIDKIGELGEVIVVT